MPTPAEVIQRAKPLVEAEMAKLRRDFVDKAAQHKAASVKAGTYGSSVSREAAHNLCAAELHTRVALTISRLFATHERMSAPPSNEHRRACKDWIAQRVAKEVDDLQQLDIFRLPRAYPDDLQKDVKRERARAFARIDNAFDALSRDWIERFWRWSVRVYKVARAALGWPAR
jgi:hypothetical protein